ncbi:hypothetical protein LTS18_004466, partial [Coniosporium uncinatum]
PLLFAPLSEVYGRVRVIQLSCLIYLIFNFMCGYSTCPWQLAVCRFLSEAGGIGPVTVGAGVLEDLFPTFKRGASMAIYALTPLLANAVSPIIGGFVAENSNWRCLFYAITIAGTMLLLIGLMSMCETYEPKLLQDKRDMLRRSTRDDRWHLDREQEPTISAELGIAMWRPFIMFFTQPVVVVLSLYYAYLDGLSFFFFSILRGIWEGLYNQRISMASLNSVSIMAGFIVGSQAAPLLNDRIHFHLRQKYNNLGKPEYRIPIMIPGAALVPMGILIYGWTAQYHLHWVLPNLGALVFSAGAMTGFSSMQTYVIDYYTSNSASAIAALTVTKSFCGAGFPLFAPITYEKLGFGVGNSVLAAVAALVGFPAPFLLWRFGGRLREKSMFAIKEEDGRF